MSTGPAVLYASNGAPIYEGDTVTIKIKSPHFSEYVTVVNGVLRYVGHGSMVSSYGCGYALVNGMRTTFLSNITRYSDSVIEKTAAANA